MRYTHFKIGEVTYRVGVAGGLSRQSLKSNKWYYMKPTDANTIKIMKKIVRSKRRLLAKKTKRLCRETTSTTVPQLKQQIKDTDKSLQDVLVSKKFNLNRELTLAFDTLIKPVLQEMEVMETTPLFDLDTDGEYAAIDSVVNEYMKDVKRMLMSRGSQTSQAHSEHISTFDEQLYSMVAEFIQDAEQRYRDKMCVDPMQDARDNLVACVDRELPSVELVKKRCGASVAHGYRMNLEALEDSPFEEFQIDPVFAKKGRFTTNTINFVLHKIALMATGDIDLILVESQKQ